MEKVFAEVGQSMQQIGGDCPDGWVEMPEPRPNHRSVAKMGEDGAFWVDPDIQEERQIFATKQGGLNEVRHVILNTITGIAWRAEVGLVPGVSAENLNDFKFNCAQLQMMILDITKYQPYLDATDQEQMEVAILTRYKEIVATIPAPFRSILSSAFRELPAV